MSIPRPTTITAPTTPPGAPHEPDHPSDPGIAMPDSHPYELWSGGFWAWQAPEYLLTTYIAWEISRIKYRPFYLTMEQHVGQALSEAGANEEIVEEAGKQKFDIMIWRGSHPYSPRGIIEVKKQVSTFAADATGQGGIKKDIDRIIASLNETNNLQFGMLAYFTSCKYGERPPMSAKKRIQTRVDKIASDAQSFVQETNAELKANMKFKRVPGRIRIMKDHTIKDGPNDHAWVAEVLRIWKPRN